MSILFFITSVLAISFDVWCGLHNSYINVLQIFLECDLQIILSVTVFYAAIISQCANSYFSVFLADKFSSLYYTSCIVDIDQYILPGINSINIISSFFASGHWIGVWN